MDEGGYKSSDPVDAVIFFDANMPGMRCCGNCENEESVLCVHRLNFKAHLEHPGGSLNEKNDFQVLELFFDLIHQHEEEWRNETKEAFFILVTRDHDFLTKDAPKDYGAALKAGGTRTRLSFGPNSVFSGHHKITVIIVREAEEGRGLKQDYKMERDDILRCMIRKLNEFWASRQDS